ncbi:MAG TPA: macro domain-containing protein [Gemmataceae bacterium]|nr:macro domain-containing protein [Gemmataceae bacterium]
MIRRVRGNLLEADVEALVNTVNTVGVMGRGVALQFKHAYPANYAEYRAACEAGEVEPGKMLVVEVNPLYNPRYIINFPTKRHWKGKSRLEDIESGLTALAGDIRRLGIKSVAVPPLGCGLGGLDWRQVFPRIEAALGHLPGVEVLVYEPEGAPAAAAMPNRTPRPRMTAGRASLLALMHGYLEPLMDDAVTLLEAHKLMYFMQEAGEPLRLDFVQGIYGPYATNLHHVFEKVEGHFLVGFGDGREAPGKTLELKAEAVRAAEAFLANRTPTRNRLARVLRLIEGFETPYGMELLASVHWVATHVEKARIDVEAAREGVAAWSERKQKLFTAEHVKVAWEHLQQDRWI